MGWRHFRSFIRDYLAGRGLRRAMQRHSEAAKALDAALREVLER